jgi:hypothetical protein
MENEYQIAPGVVIDDTAGLFKKKERTTEIVERKKVYQEPVEVKEEIKNPTVMEQSSNKKVSLLNLCALVTDKSNYIAGINNCLNALKNGTDFGVITCWSSEEEFSLPVCEKDLRAYLAQRLEEEESQLAALLQRVAEYIK